MGERTQEPNEKTKDIAVTCVMVIFLFVSAVVVWFKPVEEFSEMERRSLKQFPDTSWNNLITGSFMENFEEYALDQFPFRDGLRSLKANVNMELLGQKDNNDIYMVDGHLSKMEHPMQEDSMDRAAVRFQYVYEKYLESKGGNIYFTMIPDKNYFLAKQNGYLSMDYDTFFESMKQKMGFSQYIDITGQLETDDYYKTDTHWRQERVVDVAEELASQMNVTISGEYDMYTLNQPFYGVYYGQSGLNVDADRLHYLSNEIIENYVVYDHENGKITSVYDMEKAYGKDPYEMFLSGNLSLVTIENPGAAISKELVVFRDSFGSSIAPLLAEGYARTTLVDIRYIQPEMLGRYIEFDEQDVLFMYSTHILNNSETIR